MRQYAIRTMFENELIRLLEAGKSVYTDDEIRAELERRKEFRRELAYPAENSLVPA